MARCYLGLGSNLACPRRQIHLGIQTLKKLPRTRIVKISDLYQTKPIGLRYQPDYINAVLSIETKLTPERLLYLCKHIEIKHGRRKKQHWGPRILDIDILLYGNLSVNKHKLIIPHPEMHRRPFVLQPLYDVLA